MQTDRNTHKTHTILGRQTWRNVHKIFRRWKFQVQKANHHPDIWVIYLKLDFPTRCHKCVYFTRCGRWISITADPVVCTNWSADRSSWTLPHVMSQSFTIIIFYLLSFKLTKICNGVCNSWHRSNRVKQLFVSPYIVFWNKQKGHDLGTP